MHYKSINSSRVSRQLRIYKVIKFVFEKKYSFCLKLFLERDSFAFLDEINSCQMFRIIKKIIIIIIIIIQNNYSRACQVFPLQFQQLIF